MTTRTFLLAVVLAGGAVSFLSGCDKKPAAETWSIEELRHADDDLTKPHNLEFEFHFPTESAAQQAVPRLKDAGFEPSIKQDTQKGGWLCLATKTMVPDLLALEKIHTDLDTLANSLGGHYNGWGTAADK